MCIAINYSIGLNIHIKNKHENIEQLDGNTSMISSANMNMDQLDGNVFLDTAYGNQETQTDD